LTTAKFRMMGFLYSGYHLVDNTLFLLIIIMSIINNGFKMPSHHEIALFAAIGVEGFYDIMLYTHRYWILQRLSIYIGIVLYTIYFVIVGMISAGVVTNPEVPIEVVWYVLGVRCSAFVLEELVDIMIDIQLHNDLVKLNSERIARRNSENENNRDNLLDVNNTVDIEAGRNRNTVENDADTLIEVDKANCWHRLKNYVNVSRSVEMPNDVEYIGSVFAWGQTSVFDENVWKTNEFSGIWSICLCFLPAIPAFLVFLALLVLCCVAGLIIFVLVTLLAIITRNFNVKNYFVELVHI